MEEMLRPRLVPTGIVDVFTRTVRKKERRTAGFLTSSASALCLLLRSGSFVAPRGVHVLVDEDESRPRAQAFVPR